MLENSNIIKLTKEYNSFNLATNSPNGIIHYCNDIYSIKLKK